MSPLSAAVTTVLTCACYLAKAGLKVIVLERRHIIGGAVCTQDDLIPGYKIDVGSSAHIMIHLTPLSENWNSKNSDLFILTATRSRCADADGERRDLFLEGR
jgi:phytoene dehydrogenase-like protein